MHGKSSVSEVKNVYDDVIAQFENVGEAFDAFILSVEDPSAREREVNEHKEIEKEFTNLCKETEEYPLPFLSPKKAEESSPKQDAQDSTQRALAKIEAEKVEADTRRRMLLLEAETKWKMQMMEIGIKEARAKAGLSPQPDRENSPPKSMGEQRQDSDEKKNPQMQSDRRDTTSEVPSLSVNASPFVPSRTTQGHEVSSETSTVKELMSTLHLPPVEIMKFKGDPCEYTNFMRMFETKVLHHATRDSDRLYFLYQSLEGDAKELISGCLYMESTQGLASALSLLKSHYGNSCIISNAFIRKLMEFPEIKPNDNAGLRKLFLLVNQCHNAMQSLGDVGVLDFPTNLQMIVRKLPPYLQNKWRDRSCTLSMKGTSVKFTDLVNLLDHAASSANDPIFGREAMSASKKVSNRSTWTPRERSFSNSES